MHKHLLLSLSFIAYITLHASDERLRELIHDKIHTTHATPSNDTPTAYDLIKSMRDEKQKKLQADIAHFVPINRISWGLTGALWFSILAASCIKNGDPKSSNPANTIILGLVILKLYHTHTYYTPTQDSITNGTTEIVLLNEVMQRLQSYKNSQTAQAIPHE